MEKLEERILNLIKQLEEEKRLADKRAKQLYDLSAGAAGIPVGTIVPYLGGYFTDGANSGFTMMMATANTVAAVNTLLNPDGFYVCDGAALNLGGSPIFDGAGRYLPKLTDDRFIMGDTLGGTPGGDNAMAHTHSDNLSVNNHTLTIAQIPSHYHGYYVNQIASWADANRWVPHSSSGTNYNTKSTGGGGGHNHGLSGSVGAASNTENRPKFLGCFYIIRVI